MTDLSSRVSEVLSFLLAETQITPSELSRRINLPQSTVDRLVNAKTSDPRISTLEPIADYFKISVDQLMGKQPISKYINLGVEQTIGKTVPIINWEDAVQYAEHIKTLTLTNWFAWISTNSEVGESGFAVKLKGLAMSPRFLEGSILIVNPDCKPVDRDYVLVEYDNTTYFRQLIAEGHEQYLRALNLDYGTLRLDKPYRFLGVITESRILTKNI
jgi:SOS-response transcriptional repressor LexA